MIGISQLYWYLVKRIKTYANMNQFKIAQITDIQEAFGVGRSKAIRLKSETLKFYKKSKKKDVTILQVAEANNLKVK